MKKSFILMVLATIVLSGCNKDKITNLDQKMIGKWILAETNGKPTPTNNKYVITFTSPTKGYRCASFNEYAGSELETLWNDRQEFDYTIEGNVVTITMTVNDHLMVSQEISVRSITDSEAQGDLKVSWMVDGTVIRTMEESTRIVKVTDDYSQAILGMWECTELTGIETYNDANARLEFFADGTYNYWKKNAAGEWETVPNREFQKYFVDGTLLATCWKNVGENELREWWEIASIVGDQMQWTALRLNEDGTTVQQGMRWTKKN